MHLIKLSALLQVLSMFSITQAIILDYDSLLRWPDVVRGPLHTYTTQAFNLAFTQASVGSTQLSVLDGGPISSLANLLFTANGGPVAENILDAVGLMNQYFTNDKTTTDYENNPIVYFDLGRLVDKQREDGALWDSDAGAFMGVDPAVIRACHTGEGAEPPHFLASNYGPRAIHDTIDICPWYITWLSQHGWPMTARWNSPGAVRSLTQSAVEVAPHSSMTAMDYLQGLDQQFLSAITLVRPVYEAPPAVPPNKIWNDCVNNPNPQNPYSLGFFTTGVHFIQMGYKIGNNGAILGYDPQPKDPGWRRKRRRSFNLGAKAERDPLPV